MIHQKKIGFSFRHYLQIACYAHFTVIDADRINFYTQGLYPKKLKQTRVFETIGER